MTSVTCKSQLLPKIVIVGVLALMSSRKLISLEQAVFARRVDPKAAIFECFSLSFLTALK